MPNVWEVSTAANSYLYVQQADLRYFHGRFEGFPMADNWATPPFSVLNKSKKVADFTSWQIGSVTFLVSARAREAISGLCGKDVEFLPFATIKRTELFAVNVLRRFSVIDWPTCPEGARFGSPYSLKADLSHIPPLFKDPQSRTSFAGDELGRVAVDHSLIGLCLSDPRKNLGRKIVRGEPINEFPGL